MIGQTLSSSARHPVWLASGLALAFTLENLPTGLGAGPESNPAGLRLIASSEPGWPQFRGPRRDGVSDERGLLTSWPADGPARLGSVQNIGFGYSSPVIAGDRLFITGDFEPDLHLLAFDLEGNPLWRATNGLAWLRPYPGARSSVTFSAGRLYHQNAHGRLVCLDAASGKELWSIQMMERFGGAPPHWGLSECLVVDERAVYVTAGGREALMVALDKDTGSVLWQTPPLRIADPDPDPESASYVSPILVQFGDRRLLIGCSLRHLFCLDADRGTLQWTRPRPTTYSVIAMMPVLAGDGVFMTAPHGPPGRHYRLRPPETQDGPVGVEEGWTTDLDACQGGVVHVDGRLFGAYYGPRRGWVAVDAATGQELHQNRDLVKGAVLHADRRLYALSEDGWMRLLEPTAEGFAVRGEFRLAETRSRDVWAHPVIHAGRLYLRYHDTLSVFDIRGRR